MLEGVYSLNGVPGLLIDAEGHFWVSESIICARYESGLFTAGVASDIQTNANGTGPADDQCNSAAALGPTTVTFLAALDAGVLTLVNSFTYQAENLTTAPASYSTADGGYTLVWTQVAPSTPNLAAIEGTWPLLGLGSFTIASDGTFTLDGCAWQASIEDTAVNVYTLTSPCGVGVLTLYQGQLIGGVTIGANAIDLSVVPSNT